MPTRYDDVVATENLSSHTVKGGRDRIEAAGARSFYLPPYSSDFNPNEKAWAKLARLLSAPRHEPK